MNLEFPKLLGHPFFFGCDHSHPELPPRPLDNVFAQVWAYVVTSEYLEGEMDEAQIEGMKKRSGLMEENLCSHDLTFPTC